MAIFESNIASGWEWSFQMRAKVMQVKTTHYLGVSQSGVEGGIITR